MHGPGPGFGGPHGGMGFGPSPMIGMGFFPRRHTSLLGVGLTALFGSMIGTNLANRNTQQSYNTNTGNYNNCNYSNDTRVYEYFNYCPNCGAERKDSSKYCSYCGTSLIR